MNRFPRRRQRSKKLKKRFHRIMRRLLLLLIVGYIVWVGLNYATNVLKANLVKTELATYGNIQSTVEFEGIIIRDEIVLSVPSNGKLQIVASEGERVRVNAQVAALEIPDINSRNGIQRENINTPTAGIVSYHIDGLEKLLVPDNIKEIDMFKVWKEQSPKRRTLSDGQQVKAGENVVRIINNLSPIYIIGEIDKNKVNLEKLKSDQKIMVQLGNGNNKPVYLTITDIKLQGDRVKLTLELKNFSEEFIQNRKYPITIIKDRFEGYIIPFEAIVYKDSKPGVYIVYKQVARWRPVKVLGKINQEVAVSGLGPKTTYITNPQYIEEGQSIN